MPPKAPPRGAARVRGQPGCRVQSRRTKKKANPATSPTFTPEMATRWLMPRRVMASHWAWGMDDRSPRVRAWTSPRAGDPAKRRAMWSRRPSRSRSIQ